MTVYAVYATENGQLWSVAHDAAQVASADVLTARGFAVKQFPDGTDAGPWNAATLSFGAPPPPSLMLDPVDFLMRFTPTETARIRASADPRVQQFVFALGIQRDAINVLGTTASGGLALIASLGLFDDQAGVAGAATARITQIQTP